MSPDRCIVFIQETGRAVDEGDLRSVFKLPHFGQRLAQWPRARNTAARTAAARIWGQGHRFMLRRSAHPFGIRSVSWGSQFRRPLQTSRCVCTIGDLRRAWRALVRARTAWVDSVSVVPASARASQPEAITRR